MRVTVVRSHEIGSAETARWIELQMAQDGARSPFLSPGWVKLVGQVRPDVRIAIIERDGKIVGFFPAQRNSPFTAMGCGAPMCDYEGIIGEPDLVVCPITLARALGVGRLDFAHVPANQETFAPHKREVIESHILDLEGGIKCFFAQRRAEGSSTFRDADKKRRRIERDLGPISVTTWSKDKGAFEKLIEWKRAKTAETNQPDIYGRKWVRELLKLALHSEDPTCRGFMITMHAGDKLLSAHLALAGTYAIHGWIPGYDCAYEHYSVGLVNWMDFLQASADNGFREVDFGAGDYRYKVATSNARRSLYRGFAGGLSISSGLRTVEYTAREQLERAELGRLSTFPARAMRRLDTMRGLGMFSAQLK